jgi:uncharacterized protein (TIGR03066 family)
MKILRISLLGFLALVLAGCSGSTAKTDKAGTEPSPNTDKSPKHDTEGSHGLASNKDKLLGTWEATKGDMPPGSTLEFAKDGKLTMTVKQPGAEKPMVASGTYEVDGEKIMTTAKVGDKEHKETHTIKNLTDKTLITVDEKGKTDEFKKK